MQSRYLAIATVSGLMQLGGCSLLGGGGDSTEDNIADYEDVRLELEQKRTQVLPEWPVDDIQSNGPYLCWLDVYQGWEAILHIRDTVGGGELVSSVPIGNEEIFPNYAMSDEIAMTAISMGMDAIYTTIDLASGEALDVVVLPKPEAAKYDAYHVYANTAYIVVESEGKMIYEWTAGTGAPTPVGAIDDLGISLGAWAGFVVTEYGGSRKLIAVGTYGTFSIDLDTLATTQIPLPVMPLEGGITEWGIVATDGFDLWAHQWGSGEVRAIHDELKESSYAFNSTFYNAHWVSAGTANQDVTMNADVVYYRSNSGVYAYNLSSAAITPLLLDQKTYDGSDTFVTYTGLNYGDLGVYVVGLESTSGATGSRGPAYLISL